MSPEAKLQQLGITLPTAVAPAAAYVMVSQFENLIFVSGHIAKRDGKPWVGKLGQNMSTEEGQQAARAVAIDLIATLKHHCADLSKIKRIIKVMSLVNSAENFTEQHLVTNGCSELLVEIFGSSHARSAFGVAQLPLGACVEIELIAEC